MANKKSPDTERTTIEQIRAAYQEPDVCAHYSKPDRNVMEPSTPDNWWAVLAMKDIVEQGGRVLVLGCAGGQEAFAIVRAGYHVHGLDLVPEFIDAARSYAKSRCVEDRARFELVDGYAWPVEDASFDAVTWLANGLSNLPTRDIRMTVFRECNRVLVPGGVAFFDCDDRTRPGRESETPPPWEPDRSEDLSRKAAWGLLDEPGAIVAPNHPCKGHVNTKILYPRYEADPREVWDEIEACGLRVFRLERGETTGVTQWQRIQITVVKIPSE
jgi:SAM-dependent methyltransferase